MGMLGLSGGGCASLVRLLTFSLLNIGLDSDEDITCI